MSFARFPVWVSTHEPMPSALTIWQLFTFDPDAAIAQVVCAPSRISGMRMSFAKLLPAGVTSAALHLAVLSSYRLSTPVSPLAPLDARTVMGQIAPNFGEPSLLKQSGLTDGSTWMPNGSSPSASGGLPMHTFACAPTSGATAFQSALKSDEPCFETSIWTPSGRPSNEADAKH